MDHGTVQREEPMVVSPNIDELEVSVAKMAAKVPSSDLRRTLGNQRLRSDVP
jgi:hypothetical protein